MQANLASFQDLQYCKTDLIATKGVVFCKYAKSSSALAVLEAITDTGMVSSGHACVCCVFNILAYNPPRTFMHLHSVYNCTYRNIPHCLEWKYEGVL